MNFSQKHVKVQQIATWIYRHCSSQQTDFRSRIVVKLCRLIRDRWARSVHSGTAVDIELKRFGRLVLPLAHDLGLIIAENPEFGRNLSNLIFSLNWKYPNFTAIDIGANIGDSAVLMRRAGAARVLCIEGSADFLPFLGANVGGDEAVEIAPCFVASGVEIRGRVRVARGSLHIEPQESGDTILGKKMDQLLQEHPCFLKSRLLKIDTDGLDLAILENNLDWLSKEKPVIFFEYLPFFFHPHGTNPTSVISKLESIGYKWFCFYDNVGRFVGLLDVTADERVLHDLLRFFDRPDVRYYADIVLFHVNDEDLAFRTRESEVLLPEL